MDSHGAERTLEKRQLLTSAATFLASMLPEEEREPFLAAQTERMNRSYPAPSRASMRAYLTSNIVR